MSNVQGQRTTHVPFARSGVSVTINVPPPSWVVRLLSVSMAPAMAVIMGVDLRIRGSERILIHGIADEVAHVLTALVVFAAIRALGFPVNWVMAAFGAVVCDADYLLMWDHLMPQVGDSSRGVLHTVGPALALVLLGLVFPPGRVFFVSLGIGMLTHIMRDSATAATAPIWPISMHVYHLRYSLYLAVLAMFTAVATGVVALNYHPQRS